MPRRRITTLQIDPFKIVAHGLSTDKIDKDVWEEKPVDIETFVNGKKFLNQKWNGKTGCRPKIMEILKEVSKDTVREAILLLGKGAGKDYTSAIIHLYGIYKSLCLFSPQEYYGLAPGSPIYFVNTARNDEQAKRVFFAQFKGLLGNAPWFEGKYSEPGASSVTFEKGITALSANSQAYSWLGYNTIQWVGDELAFFLTNDTDEEGAESRAEECWEAAYGSCQTRFPDHYKMIGITTPRFDDDFVMRKFYELGGRSDGYVKQAATWEIHPTLTKEDFKHALARDFRRAMRDFGAQPSGVIESFWSDPEFIDSNPCEECRNCPIWAERKLKNDDWCCYDYDECKANIYRGNGRWREELMKPNPDFEYWMHFDLAKNKDKLNFSLGHVFDWIRLEMDGYKLNELGLKDRESIDDEAKYEDKPMIKIDCIGFIDPKLNRDIDLLKNREIHYPSLLNKIIVFLIKKGYNIGGITFDSFQSLMLKQTLSDMGVETDLISLDRNDEVPVAAKTAIVENRVYYPWCKELAYEARHLKYFKSKKVDHIRGMDKDLCDSFFGTIFNVEKNSGGSGTFEDLGMPG